jgi:hypothetical protein
LGSKKSCVPTQGPEFAKKAGRLLKILSLTVLPAGQQNFIMAHALYNFPER